LSRPTGGISGLLEERHAQTGAVNATVGIMISAAETQDDEAAVCRTCGACCSFSSEWPRFSLESDADLDRIPRAFVDDGQGHMRCNGDRCTALLGDVGVSTSCAVYAVRPEVCRVCMPGDDACQMARRRFNLRLGMQDLGANDRSGI
jgi:Fe-S-cluster containining protein